MNYNNLQELTMKIKNIEHELAESLAKLIDL